MYLLQPIPLTVSVLSLLFACLDWKFREVPVWLILATDVLGIGLCIFGRREAFSILYAVIPGILMILFSFVSDGTLGLGDGAFVCSMGLYMSWQQVCILLATAFLAAGLTALGMIVCFMMKGAAVRRKKLPFLCFMPPGVIMAFMLVQGET